MSDTKELTRYQQRRLEVAPERTARFLKGHAGSAAIQRALRPHGLTPARIGEAKVLLLDSLGGLPPEAPALEEALDVEAARGALTELDQNDEAINARIRAALDHYFPALSERVFLNIKPGAGAAAITFIITLTTRLTELGQTEEGRTALALLAERGFPAAEIKRLHDLANLALGAPEAGDAEEAGEADDNEPPAEPAADPRHAATLRLLAWYTDWSTVARSVIKRRDQLISLGLIERRAGNKREAPGDLPE